VIPLLDEVAHISPTLAALERAAPEAEVILVDGGSRDGTLALLEGRIQEQRPRFRLFHAAKRGRGEQMNLGASHAHGEVLLFLHADSLLPSDAAVRIQEAIGRCEIVGGAFRHRFQERTLGLGLVSAFSNLRSRLRHSFYGDQGLFLRREAFEALGGFPSRPLFEDLELSRNMKRLGRTVLLPSVIATSGRRFLDGGVLRTAARMTWLKLRHAWGADLSQASRNYWVQRKPGAPS
jgi:rSAM/selenodomain-associated transferase 2